MGAGTVSRFVLVVALTVSLSANAAAQAALGPGDDATVLPRGTLRVHVGNQWTQYDERFGALDGDDGTLPLGAELTTDSLGVRQVPQLAGLERQLRTLAADPNFRLSLGRAVTTASVSKTTTPVVIELGLTSRLMLGVTVPYIRTRSTVGMTLNPSGNEGNVALNPELSTNATLAQAARTRNATFYTQFQGAYAELLREKSRCAGSTTPDCAAVNANADRLLALSARLLTGIGNVFGGRSPWAPSPVVPVLGSPVQTTIQRHIDSLRVGYESLRQQGANITVPTAVGPMAAPAALGIADFERLLTEPAFGVGASPFGIVERSHLGDIEAGARFLVFDSFRAPGRNRLSPRGVNFRASVGGLVRFGTGQRDSPDDFFDVGTGDGQTDVELHSASDVLLGRRFWTSLTVRYAVQLRDRAELRITDEPTQAVPGGVRRQEVERDLGDVLEVEAAPRVALNDYVVFSGHYLYRHKASDRHTGRFRIDVSQYLGGEEYEEFDAATLDADTEAYEHRVGAGLTFSTLAAVARGRGRLPLEVSFLHVESVLGAGGRTPKLAQDQVRVRVYTRLWGR